MSNVIDQKVVEMRFDNKQFESGVRTSLSTLNNLKQGLNLTGASKGLESISAAAKNVNFSPISNGVDVVVSKFSHLQMSVQHQLDKIVDHAIASGKRIVDALTVDPVKMGFQEYETQINAVQTILANTESKGTTLNDVNLALDTLNKYADKTIYNFTEMTRNIGTFTAAGVDLDTSVNAIQGIANLAAISGSSSQQASTAMYQLSQALSSGTVKLMDWNSVVNAGMGGQVFQDALKETARVHGIAIDSMIEEQGSFRETLSEGWLTSEILTETLQKFTLTTEGLTEQQIEANRQMLKSKGYTEEQIEEIFKLGNTATNAATKVKTFTQLFDTLKEAAQSGWTQTWETIVGDFEESKELMTGISDAVGKFINATSESRNELLSGALDTNWEKLIKNINEAGIETNTFEEKARAAMKAHGLDVDALIEEHGSLEEAFRSGAVSSDILKEAVDSLTGSLVDLSGIERDLKVGVSGDDVKLAQEALKNLGYDLGSYGIDGKFGSVTEKAVKSFQELNGLEVTGIIDDKTLAALEKASESSAKLSENCDNLIDKITELGGREKIIESLKNVFKYLGDVIKPIKEAFRDIFPKTEVAQVQGWIESFHEFTKGLKLTGEQAKNIKSIFTGFFSAIDIGLTLIKELIGGAFRLLGNFTGLGGSVLEVAAAFGDWLTNLRNSIKDADIFGKGIDTIVGFISGFIDKLKICKKSIDDAFDNPKFKGILGFFKGLWSIMELIGSKIAGVFSSITGGFVDTLGNPNLWNVVNSGLFAGILTGIARFTNKLPGMLDGIGDILENATGILDDVRGCFEAYQNQLKAGTLMKIASAIALLAGAILIVAMIPEDALDRSLGAITILFGELIGSLAMFGKLSGELKGVIKSSTIMIALSISLVILAAALKILSTIDSESIAAGLLAIGTLMAELALFLEFAKFDGKIIRSTLGIVILSAALLILAKAVKSFSSMDWSELARGLTGVGVALGAVTLALKLMPGNWTATFDKLTVKSKPKLISAGIAFVAIAASMKIFASAMKDFSKLKWEDIGKGLAVIAATLAVVVIAINKFPKNALGDMSHGMVGFGIGLIAMATAMLILTEVLNRTKKLKWEEIGKGLAVIAGSLLSFSIAARLLSKTQSSMVGFGVGLIAMAAAMLILTDVFEKIKGYTLPEIGKGLAVIGGSMLIMAFALKAMSGTVSGAAALIIAAGALAIITPMIKTLGNMSVESIIKSLITLAATFAIIGVAAVLLQPVIPAILGLAGALALLGVGMLGIGAGIVLISAGLAALATVGTVGATAIVAALTIIITGVANLIPLVLEKIGEGIVQLCLLIGEYAPQLAEAFLKLLLETLKALATYAPQIIDSLLTLLIGLLQSLAEHLPELIQVAMDVIGAFFQGIVDALNGMDTSTLFKGIVGVGLLAGLMFALSAVTSLIPGAMAGVLGMGIVIAELALVLAAIGALAQIPGLQWLITEGGNLLQSVGTAIGQFIGGIVGGFMGGVSSSFPEIGQNLSDFMKNAEGFINGCKNVDAATLAGAGYLAGAILAMTAANLIAGITEFLPFVGNFATLGEDLSAFMTNATPFIAGLQSIDETAITAASCVADLIMTLTKAELLEGIASFFGININFADFGTQLVAFGSAVVAFSNTLSNNGGIDSAAITAAANAGKIMTALQQDLVGTGGVVQWFAGEKDLAGFGAQLKAFGTAIVDFSNTVSAEGAINENAIAAAAKAGELMTTLQEKIQPTDGVIQWFCGEQNFETFGSQLEAFGSSLVSFSSTVAGNIDQDAITAANDAGTMMTTLQASIPEDKWLDGKMSLDDFGKTLVKFAEKMVEFSDECADIDKTKISNASGAAGILNGMLKALAESKTAGFSFFGEDKMGKLLPGLLSFQESISGFDSTSVSPVVTACTNIAEMVNNLAEIDLSGVTSFRSAVNGLKTIDIAGMVENFSTDVSGVAEIGTKIMDAINNSFSKGSSSLGKTLSASLKTAVGSVDGVTGLYTNKATNLMNNFVKGMSSKKEALKNCTSAMVKAAVASINNHQTSFYSAGSNLVDGFKNGISANSYKAAAQAAAMAEAAKQAAEEALGIKSPSRVFYGIGDYTGQGFINALADYAVKSYKAGSEMANSAREGLTNAISKATDVLSGKTDMQPTIRPVVDLSGVESGTSAINSMLSMGSRIGISANVGAVSSMMSRRNQNGVNSDIVAAIDRLDKHLDNVGGTSYNVNGITYDDGSNVKEAIETLVRAARIERRV